MKSETGTVVVVVVIAAIALYLIMNNGQKKVVPQQQSGGTSYLNGLLSLGGAVVTAIGGKPQAPSQAGVTSYFGQGDSMTQAAYGLSHGTVEQSGNQLIDLNTGNALVYGAE